MHATEYMPCGWWICMSSTIIAGPYETKEKADEELKNIPNWPDKSMMNTWIKEIYAAHPEDFQSIYEPDQS